MARSTFSGLGLMALSLFLWRSLPSLGWRFVDDATRQVRLARWAMHRRFAPAIRSDRTPSRFAAGEAAKPGDELAVGQPKRHLAGDLTMAAVVPVALGEVPCQAFVDRPGAEDE